VGRRRGADLPGGITAEFGLAKASERIPIGTAYAVWVGIGAVLTVGWATVTGEEPLSWGRAIFIAGIVVAVVGLKLVPAQRGDAGKAAGA
jgi:quaternary ammonium compound-resistance protein SugE